MIDLYPILPVPLATSRPQKPCQCHSPSPTAQTHCSHRNVIIALNLSISHCGHKSIWKSNKGNATQSFLLSSYKEITGMLVWDIPSKLFNDITSKKYT